MATTESDQKRETQVHVQMWPILIKVYQINPDRWVAEINGGWWVATGKTRNAAIDAVTRRYVAEQEEYFC